MVWGTPLPFGECFKPKKIFTRPAPCAPDPFFWYFRVIFPENLGHRFWPIRDLVVWIFVFTACLGISLGVNFFVWPNFDFWAQGRGSKLVPEPQKSKTVKNGRKNLKKSPKILKNIKFYKNLKKIYFWVIWGSLSPFWAHFVPKNQ